MTREEILTALENAKLHAAFESDVEILDVCMSALREQEERSSKKISTLKELNSLQGRCVLWNGEICSCKNGYLVTDNGTFSFDWVLSHGEVYSCPMCGRRLEEV